MINIRRRNLVFAVKSILQDKRGALDDMKAGRPLWCGHSATEEAVQTLELVTDLEQAMYTLFKEIETRPDFLRNAIEDQGIFIDNEKDEVLLMSPIERMGWCISTIDGFKQILVDHIAADPLSSLTEQVEAGLIPFLTTSPDNQLHLLTLIIQEQIDEIGRLHSQGVGTIFNVSDLYEMRNVFVSVIDGSGGDGSKIFEDVVNELPDTSDSQKIVVDIMPRMLKRLEDIVLAQKPN